MTRVASALTGLALISGFAGPAAAQDMPGMDMPKTAPKPPATTPKPASDDMAGMDMKGMDMGSMTGLLGSYPMTRDASGTSWEPDA